MDYNTRYISVLIFTMMLAPGCLSLEDIEPEVIEGCTDEVALNFDENANANDGSCEYEPEETFEGCTSPSAVNFDPEALVNDGSCIFEASAPEIDSALSSISDALDAFQNREVMSTTLLLETGYDDHLMKATYDAEGAKLELAGAYSISDSDGLVTACDISTNVCMQFRNLGENGQANLGMALGMLDLDVHLYDYNILSSLEIPSGAEWDVTMSSTESTYQTATYGQGTNSLTATLSVSSVSLISLEVGGNELSLLDESMDMPDSENYSRDPVHIVWDEPIISQSGPTYVWGSCMINMVDLDSLDDEDVESVNYAMYYDIDYPDFCGEPVEDDPENGTISSSGPIFDTRWGQVTYIYDPQTEELKEIVMELDYGATSTTYYLLDVTADECSENGGTYDPLTQTCEWMVEESNNTASNLYFCQESEWWEWCDRYGINADGHLVIAREQEDSGGGDPPDGGEMIWDCNDSLFAEDITPLSSDSDEDVQEEVDAMTEPDWCGQLIEWNDSFESDPSSQGAIADSNWNNPDAFYLDFTSTGALNVGDREATQSDCSEYGGSWNAIEEACEFPNGEWTANETLIEIDFGFGMVERLRYEMIDGGIVLAFSAENGSNTGTPDMANTFYEGYEETGYDAYQFTSSEDGLHIIESVQDGDGYLYLYEGSFDPADPLVNILASQDDWDFGDDWGSAIHWDLVSGQDYIIVTTTYSAGDELYFDNIVSTPSGDETSWSGTIDSDSLIFVRPDGYWEEGGTGGGTGLSVVTPVSESHWNEVSLEELTLKLYADGMFLGSMQMSIPSAIFEGVTVAILDNDGDGLLSAGDEVVVQSEGYSDVWFEVWDDWAEDYAIEE